MSIEVEETEYCKVKVHYTAEPEKVLDKRTKITDDIFAEAQDAIIPGYRKGKAPLSAIKMRFRKQIEEATRRELLSQAYEDILFETKMKPIFYPQVHSVQLNDSHFECELMFLKKPAFELKQYKDFEIPKPAQKQSAEVVEAMLQQLRMQQGDIVPFAENDFIQMGDKVILDIKCEVEGTAVEQLTKEGTLYTVGQGFYQDFDDNIQGMAAGETRTFDVLWDTTTQQRATFTVTLHNGTKIIPCPLDDELAKKFKLASLSDLRKQVEGMGVTQLAGQLKKMLAEQVISRLLSAHDFEVPVWLAEAEAQTVALQYNTKFEDLDDKSKEIVFERAQKQVRLSLILDSIREVEVETQFSETELVALLKTRVQESGQDPEKFLVESQKSGRLFGLVTALQYEATIDWLINHSKIIE